MSNPYNDLVQTLSKGQKKREKGKLLQEDIKEVYSAASKLFDGEINLSPQQIEEARDKWAALADGKTDKASAIKKLQGTSRAETMQSVLLSSI